jgi:hypothetical protein
MKVSLRWLVLIPFLLLAQAYPMYSSCKGSMKGQVKTAVAWQMLEMDPEDLCTSKPRVSTLRHNKKLAEATTLSAERKFIEKLDKLQRRQLTPFEVSSWIRFLVVAHINGLLIIWLCGWHEALARRKAIIIR